MSFRRLAFVLFLIFLPICISLDPFNVEISYENDNSTSFQLSWEATYSPSIDEFKYFIVERLPTITHIPKNWYDIGFAPFNYLLSHPNTFACTGVCDPITNPSCCSYILLPFEVYFYGYTYNTAILHSSGILFFSNSPVYVDAYSYATFPRSNMPYPMILFNYYPYGWGTENATLDSDRLFYRTAFVDDNVFVIDIFNWTACKACTTPAMFSAQILLYTNGSLVLQYSDLSFQEPSVTARSSFGLQPKYGKYFEKIDYYYHPSPSSSFPCLNCTAFHFDTNTSSDVSLNLNGCDSSNLVSSESWIVPAPFHMNKRFECTIKSYEALRWIKFGVRASYINDMTSSVAYSNTFLIREDENNPISLTIYDPYNGLNCSNCIYIKFNYIPSPYCYDFFYWELLDENGDNVTVSSCSNDGFGSTLASQELDYCVWYPSDGVAHRVSIQAICGIDSSSIKAYSNSLKIGSISAPIDLSVTPISDNTYKLSWNSGSDPCLFFDRWMFESLNPTVEYTIEFIPTEGEFGRGTTEANLIIHTLSEDSFQLYIRDGCIDPKVSAPSIFTIYRIPSAISSFSLIGNFLYWSIPSHTCSSFGYYDVEIVDRNYFDNAFGYMCDRYMLGSIMNSLSTTSCELFGLNVNNTYNISIRQVCANDQPSSFKRYISVTRVGVANPTASLLYGTSERELRLEFNRKGGSCESFGSSHLNFTVGFVYNEGTCANHYSGEKFNNIITDAYMTRVFVNDGLCVNSSNGGWYTISGTLCPDGRSILWNHFYVDLYDEKDGIPYPCGYSRGLGLVPDIDPIYFGACGVSPTAYTIPQYACLEYSPSCSTPLICTNPSLESVYCNCTINIPIIDNINPLVQYAIRENCDNNIYSSSYTFSNTKYLTHEISGKWISGSLNKILFPSYIEETLSPFPRYGSQVWVHPSGNVWLYAGLTTKPYLSQQGVLSARQAQYDDLWLYHSVDNKWSLIRNASSSSPLYPANYGDYGTSYTPGPRYGATTWMTANDLWMYGGINTDSTDESYMDLWLFKPFLPAPLRYYDVTRMVGWYWMAGCQGGMLNIGKSIESPGPRFFCGGWQKGTETFYLFGGTIRYTEIPMTSRSLLSETISYTRDMFYSDIWAFHSSAFSTTTGVNWTIIRNDNNTFGWDNPRFWDTGYYPPVKTYDIEAYPSSRAYPVLFYDSDDDILYLYGGVVTFSSEQGTSGYPTSLSDLWLWDGIYWVLLAHGNAPHFGIIGIPSPLNYPRSRSYRVPFKSPTNNEKLWYFFNGISFDDIGFLNIYNDFWSLNFNEGPTNPSFTWLGGSRTVPYHYSGNVSYNPFYSLILPIMISFPFNSEFRVFGGQLMQMSSDSQFPNLYYPSEMLEYDLNICDNELFEVIKQCGWSPKEVIYPLPSCTYGSSCAIAFLKYSKCFINAYIKPSHSCYSFGDKYQSIHTWIYSMTEHCLRFDCEPISDSHTLANVNTSICDKFHWSDETCHLWCHYGHYSPSVPISAFCDSYTEGWVINGVCQPYNCEDTHPISTFIANTNYTDCSANSFYGQSCEISCLFGYESITPPSAYCNASGYWVVSGGPCDPVCCSYPIGMAHAETTSCEMSSNCYSYPPCVIFCLDDYESSQHVPYIEGVICNESAKWDYDDICAPVACDSILLNPLVNDTSRYDLADCILHDTIDVSCTLSCMEGYIPSGGVSLSATCTPDPPLYEWSITGYCEPASCPSNITLSNTNTNDCQIHHLYNETCTVSCDEGFYPFPETPVVYCQPNGTWYIDSYCGELNCGVQFPLDNIERYDTTDCVNNPFYTQTCSLYCNDGYEPHELSIKCNSTGYWNVTGSCETVDCGQITDPNIDTSSCSTLYNEVCTISCVPGYYGNLSAICTSEKTWDIGGECNPINCGALELGPEYDTVHCSSHSNYSDLCNLSCNDGYIPSNDLAATCSVDELWVINGTCNPVNCSIDISLEGGVVTDCIDQHHYNENCSISCEDGYTGNPTALCNAQGVWELSNWQCDSIVCPLLELEATVNVDDCNLHPNYSESCILFCNHGYVGPITATCTTNGTWFIEGSCLGADCSTPPDLPHTNTTDCAIHSRYGDSCTIECSEEGYIDPPTLYCNGSGAWNPTSPIPCSPISCSTELDLDSFFINATDCNMHHHYMEGCELECFNGYESEETPSAICNSEGSWLYNNITCTPVNCNDLILLPNQAAWNVSDCNIHSSYRETCTPTCLSGYYQSEPLSPFCSEEGVWEYATGAYCLPISCYDSTIRPKYANMSDCFSHPYYNQSCSVVCLSDYIGDPAIACDSNGEWLILSDNCHAVECSSLPSVPSTWIVNDCVENNLSNDTCTVLCSENYTAGSSPPSLDCDIYGEFIVSGECSLVDCGSVVYTIASVNSSDCDNNTLSNQRCVLTCMGDFTGLINARCSISGSWTFTGSCTSTLSSSLSFFEKIPYYYLIPIGVGILLLLIILFYAIHRYIKKRKLQDNTAKIAESLPQPTSITYNTVPVKETVAEEPFQFSIPQKRVPTPPPPPKKSPRKPKVKIFDENPKPIHVPQVELSRILQSNVYDIHFAPLETWELNIPPDRY